MVTTNRADVSQHSSASCHVAWPSLTLSGGLGFARDQEEAEVGTWELLREPRQRGGSGQSTCGREFLVRVRVK